MVNDKKSLEKSDPPFVCVRGKGCGQVRTREGVHFASWTAKPEMMSVVHDDRGRAWAQPQKQTLAAFDQSRNEVCRIQQTGCKVSDRIFKGRLNVG